MSSVVGADSLHRPNVWRLFGVTFKGVFVLARRAVCPTWPTDHFELTLLSRIIHGFEWRYARHAEQWRNMRSRVKHMKQMISRARGRET
jgi:hypothetical protein